MKEEAHRIDIHVGAKVRQLRKLKRVSQANLARAIGVSFQQVHKYELGLNRISSSVLFSIAERLGVEVGALFDGLGHASARSDSPRPFDEMLSTEEGLEIAAAFSAMPPRRRKALSDLAQSMAEWSAAE